MLPNRNQRWRHQLHEIEWGGPGGLAVDPVHNKVKVAVGVKPDLMPAAE